MRYPLAAIALVVLITSLLGCGGGNPVAPAQEPTIQAAVHGGTQTHLWGMYDVVIDVPSLTAIAIPDRDSMFTANVVQFLNSSSTNMAFQIKEVKVDAQYTDVDIDVTLKHPFPGLTQYNGYDVRGVFMGNGSGGMDYNPSLVYPVFGTDQFMFPNPEVPGDTGGPDGYTRWFNKTEFSKGGMPIFQYTQGKAASQGYSGTATLCPYKYYADFLEADDDLWTWLNDPDTNNPNSVFSAGQANTRNYYLRFPSAVGIKFSYAVIANWNGDDPDDHPANAPEAVALEVTDNSTLYYVDPTNNGGSLNLDLSVWDWDSQVSDGTMQDYVVKVESTVLSSVYALTTDEMTPIGGGESYSTFHVEIPADNVNGPDGNEYWVIVECSDEDYSNAFGQMNDAWNDPLATFFRYDIEIGNQVPPVAKAKFEGAGPFSACDSITFMDDGSYDPDGTIVKYEWDWENDGIFDETGANVTHKFESGGVSEVQFRVTDNDGLTDILDSPLEVPVDESGGWAETWGGSEDDVAYKALLVTPSGDLLITGAFRGIVDFDPGDGFENRTSNGGNDAFLLRLTSCGEFISVLTWGSTEWNGDYGQSVCLNSSGNIYVSGSFTGTCDFDPGSGVKEYTGDTNDSSDCYLSKFDSAENYLWTVVWGGDASWGSYDLTGGVACDSSGNVYVVGYWFYYNIDLDPGIDEDWHSLVGGCDIFLIKLDPSGAYQWGKSWGGSSYDSAGAIAIDNQDYVYVGGGCRTVVDFDPGSGYDNYDCGYGTDAFISKFEPDGDYVWGQRWGGALDRYNIDDAGADALFLDPSDSFLLAGGGDGNEDAILRQYDLDGNLVWSDVFGTSGTGIREGVTGVSMTPDGKIWTTGYFIGTVDFDPGSGTANSSSNGGNDIFLSRFDSSGIFELVRTWGGSSNEWAYGNPVCTSGSVYSLGSFADTVDFDPGSGTDNHNSNGGLDFFLSRFKTDGNW